jgi:Ring hydroxylating alpha subunit (catalytic domain)
VLEPIAIDKTTMVIFQLVHGEPTSGDGGDAARDAAFVRIGAAEDRAVAVAVQRGLTSGANEFLEFGRFEGAITHFHRQLTDLVDNAGSAFGVA